MRRITVKDNQSLFDIAVQEYGMISYVVALAQSNDLSITEELTAGQELIIPELLTEQSVLKYYAENNIIPATDTSSITDAALLQIIEDGNTEGYNLFYLLLGTDNTSSLLVDDDTYLLTI